LNEARTRFLFFCRHCLHFLIALNHPNDSEFAIEVEDLTVSYGPVPALLDVSVQIPAGQLIGVIGPNGSGKSTLIKAMMGFVKPDVGQVFLWGEEVSHTKGKVAYVPQRGTVDWDFPITVREVAAMGRYGHRRWWQDLLRSDYSMADQALEKVRMSEFAKRQIGQLSGGQQQRVFMARALAQDADILLLDEPFAGVDAATERAILDVLQQTREQGKTVVVVHHDLATAAEYFDQLILLKQRLFGFGPPRSVLNAELLCDVYEGNLKVFAELSRQEDVQSEVVQSEDVQSKDAQP
jgi:manganese/iron transport system ATP-binding protein/manganese/zinc/iron transport system ATP- binding protein